MSYVMKGYRAIDLTHVLDESVPTWTGSCGFKHEIRMDYEEGLRVLSYKCHGGVGTHMDAPAHFYRDGATIADIPLDQLIVPARVIDVSEKTHADFFLSREDVLAYEKKWGKIEATSLVFAYTGWDRFWKEPEKFRNADADGRMHFPGFDAGAAELLVERNIAGIGIDTLSPDGSNNNQGKFPVHECILGAGKYIIEGAANLSQMPPKGAYALALPIKVGVGVEAAMRLVGLIPQ